MIIKTFHLENFQAHVDTFLTFEDGLNIIGGPSDVGKSSIFRALRKLIRDDPAGKSFINQNATSMKLTLVFEKNGQHYTLIRQVTASKNLYYLDDAEYGGFGRQIPEEIQSALEMYIISLENADAIDLHFTGQHDPAFMMGKGTAGTRAKVIGTLAGLALLDRGIININADVKKARHSLTNTQTRITEVQGVIDEFIDVPRAEETATKLIQKYNIITKKIERLTQLQKLQEQLKQVIITGHKTKKACDQIPIIDVDFSNLRARKVHIDKLQEMYEVITKVTSRIAHHEKSPLIKFNGTDVDDKFTHAKKVQTDITQFQNFETSIIALHSRIGIAMGHVEKTKEELQKVKVQHMAKLRELKICPTCKQSTEQL